MIYYIIIFMSLCNVYFINNNSWQNTEIQKIGGGSNILRSPKRSSKIGGAGMKLAQVTSTGFVYESDERL